MSSEALSSSTSQSGILVLNTKLSELWCIQPSKGEPRLQVEGWRGSWLKENLKTISKIDFIWWSFIQVIDNHGTCGPISYHSSYVSSFSLPSSKTITSNPLPSPQASRACSANLTVRAGDPVNRKQKPSNEAFHAFSRPISQVLHWRLQPSGFPPDSVGKPLLPTNPEVKPVTSVHRSLVTLSHVKPKALWRPTMSFPLCTLLLCSHPHLLIPPFWLWF